MKLDDLDLSILRCMQEDGRRPFTEMAKALGVTEGTVRNRVARLIQAQAVQIVGLVNPHRVGYDAPALIGVSVQPSVLDEIATEIAALPEVSYLIMVSGEFDLMVEVMCRDRDHLATFIRDRLQRLEGVVRTQTFFILHTYKMAQGALPVLTNGR